MEPRRSPLRTTKLNPPRIRSDIVARPRLVERLNRDVRRPLTLVSAPAGYGKSTLVAQWLESSSLPGVWLSLDEGDNDPRSFLAYLVAAARQHSPKACQGILDLMGAAELPAPAVLADELANELEVILTPFILALDDYHRISNPEIHELFMELLEHPPRSLHLAVLTRHDPPLPLSSMRASGLAIEIREADLQFSQEETRAVFKGTAEIDLDPDSLARIMGGFEGWIVGLRMVCLALRHHDDPKAYLSGLSGDLGQVQEYLAEQVLSRQTPELQDCLVKTSILDRFCASLCDALCTGDRGRHPGNDLSGKEFIRTVSEANLFTVDLDARGQWMRYHHLFRQVLQHLLDGRADPEEIRRLHRRASRWFAANELVEEALEHALTADDPEAAADIIEQHRVRTLNADQWPVLAGWLAQLPEEVVWNRPELLLGEAWLAYYRFRIPALIRIIERIDELFADDATRPAWVGELAMFKAFLCYWQGEAQTMLEHVATAQDFLPITHDLMRADSEIYFGLAHHMAGQRDVAIEALTHRLREQPARESLLPTRRVITLAFIHLLSGDLNQTAIHSRQLGELAWTSSPVYITSWSMYLLGCCHLQSGDWDGAERCFRWMAENRYVAHTATVMSSLTGLALALHFLDRPDDSAEVVKLLRDYAVESKDPGNLAMAESARVRIDLLCGSAPVPPKSASAPDAAASMATAFIFVELPVVTRCRLLIGQDSKESLEEALATINDLEIAAQAINNTFHLIDLLALEAVALDKLDRRKESMDALLRALDLAAPGEWVRPFVELGQPMARLLEAVRDQGSGVGDQGFRMQAERILERFERLVTSSPNKQPTRSDELLVEALTHRELDVLELLTERLYDKEIAARLGITIATVKTHLRNLYQKLGVGNRRQAVIRAEELGLL